MKFYSWTCTWSIAGYYRASPHFGSGSDIWYHSICHDGIWMDSTKGVLEPLLHLLQFLILHFLWHDDHGHNS